MTKRLARILYLLFPLVLALNFQTAIASDLWVYTSIGDSLAFGAYAPPGFGYVPVYKRHIETDTTNSVLMNPLGIPGSTSAQLHNALKNNSYFRFTVRNSKVLTVNIGGNDLNIARNHYRSGNCGGVDNQNCLKAAVQDFQTNWNGILSEY